MEQPGQYPPRRQHLFHSSQLPPPSQLQLPSSTFSRSNTLPPIPTIPSAPPLHPFSSVNTYQNPHPISPTTLPPLPSPTSQQIPWSTHHRTSNSREEHYSPQHRNLTRSETSVLPGPKHEPCPSHCSFSHHHEVDPQPLPPHQAKESVVVEDGMPSTSDFVKKLYKMLEDQSFQHVVSWGPRGDCFVVKDMNEFTKSILPRMFKHSNFASFVRQLNKYDFHKVKNTDDNQFGEHTWTFRHPDFHANRLDALENIKRKVPSQRKSLPNPTTQSGVLSDPVPSYSASGASNSPQVEALQAQVDRLTQLHEDMSEHVHSLERNYQEVLAEMVNFQRNMAQQDGLMQSLIQYFLQVENGRGRAQNTSMENGCPPTDSPDRNPFLPTQEAQRMMGAYPESDVARASLLQMNEISRRAEIAGLSFNDEPSGSGNNARGRITPQLLAGTATGLMAWEPSSSKPMSREEALARIEELQRSRPTSAQGRVGFGTSGDETFILPEDSQTGETRDGLQNWVGAGPVAGDGMSSTHQGLQVYTLGHLMPRSSVDDANGNWSFDASTLGVAGDSASSEPSAIPIADGTEVLDSQLTESSTYGVSGQPTPFIDSDTEETVNPSPPLPGQESSGTSRKLRVRRSTFVPGWAVPPRVLLVDDDAVSRKLSSKFLQIFGCTIDVAVDGVGAVNKMNLEKYDLVLMDIVMPKLDGVSATSLIRQFDPMTPIISMTSNSKPDEIMTYYSSGMNDILPKPFTKEGLRDMLEKHLMHLTVIQQMSKVPKAIGGDDAVEGALSSPTTTSDLGSTGQLQVLNGNMFPDGNQGSLDDDGRINPLAGMGLTVEQYTAILQNMVNAESFSAVTRNMDAGIGGTVASAGEKRGLEDPDTSRERKRSRFELVG